MKKNSKDDTIIDFVIPYVNMNDVAWKLERSKFTDETIDFNDSSDVRYRDYGTIKYVFRSISKYAPWVNCVYLIIDRTTSVPLFLNLEYEKLRIVYHDEFIPVEYLPTYNSHTIELFLHKIPDLSEHFVYFNDDMLLMQSVEKSDFFIDGLPCYMFTELCFHPMDYCAYSRAVYNNIAIINSYFEKPKKYQLVKQYIPRYSKKRFIVESIVRIILYYLTPRYYAKLFPNYYANICFWHTPNPLRKSTYDKVWNKNSSLLKRLATHRFRNFEDVNQYLFAEWDIASGNFNNRNFSYFFTDLWELSHDASCIQKIRKHEFKFLCINDSYPTYNNGDNQIEKQLQQELEYIFPQPCEYEKK